MQNNLIAPVDDEHQRKDMRMNRFTIIAIAVLLVIHPDEANSQVRAGGVGFGIGSYHCIDAATSPLSEQPWEFVVDRNPTYGIELYFQNILDAEARYRTGIKFFHHTATANPRYPDEVNVAMRKGIKYQLMCFLASCQYKMCGGASMPLLIDMSAGVAYRIDNTQSDSHTFGFHYGNGYHGGIVIEPGIVIIPRLGDHLGLEFSVHTMLFSMAKEDMYPFSSGVHVQISLLFEP